MRIANMHIHQQNIHINNIFILLKLKYEANTQKHEIIQKRKKPAEKWRKPGGRSSI